uniref:Mitochondrial transcription termination factor n=1 Tax=Kalanchoe fedtschenkoi TaxID=63787 RepID=A0A7N0TQ04_KALFE
MSSVRFRLSIPFDSLLKRFFATRVCVSDSASLHSTAANHLIHSYGLPPESAFAVAAKLSLNDKKLANSDSVVGVFKAYDFTAAQIAHLILTRPSTLAARVTTLRPKLQFLRENGFTGTHLTRLIVTSPAILGKGVTCDLQPCLEFLKKMLGTQENVVAAVMRSTQALTYGLCKNMQPNIDMMMAQGVPLSVISKCIMTQPRTLMQKPERVVHATAKVTNVLGISPTAPMFIHATRAVLSMSQATWDRKMEFFKSLGWSEKDIVSVLTHHPLCVSGSEEKIRTSWNFFINEVKYDLSTIVANPKFLMYGLETRVRPRFNVFKILKSMGLVNQKLQFSYVLSKNEKDFVEIYILPHQKLAPQLMYILSGAAPAVVGKVKKCTKAQRAEAAS